MSNTRLTYAGTTLRVRLIALCAALVASWSVLGTVLVLFDGASDATSMAQAPVKATKVALATPAPQAAGRR
jgi:hypothetical protein